MQVYLTWIPLVYIFNTNLLEILLSLFPRPEFRNLALQCLTEVGALPEVGEEHNQKFLLLFQHFMTSLHGVLPISMNVAEVSSPAFHVLSHELYSSLCMCMYRFIVHSPAESASL